MKPASPSPGDDGADQDQGKYAAATETPTARGGKLTARSTRVSDGTADTDQDSSEDTATAAINDLDRDDLVVAIRQVFAHVDRHGIDREEAVRRTAQHLGFQRLGSRIRAAVNGALLAATRRGVTCSEGGLVFPDCRTIADYSRDLLKRYILTAMGSAWRERDDVVQATARHLGFARTGQRIREDVNSAITGLIRQGELERDGAGIRRV